jgi:hypothetical protein
VTKKYGYTDQPPEADQKFNNRERILLMFKEAGPGVQFSGAEVEKRTGVKNPYEYLARLALRGELVRVRQGIYALARHDSPVDEAPASIDDRMAEDIRANEREQIVTETMKLVEGAVPRETLDYLRGFQEGAEYVLSAIAKREVTLSVKAPD